MTVRDQSVKALTDPGDDSAILRIIAAWGPDIAAVMAVRTGHSVAQATPDRRIALNIARGEKRQHHFITISKDDWQLMKLGSSVWEITPSLNISGQIHAFVTLVGVPDPAPWERAMPPQADAPVPKKRKFQAKCSKCGDSSELDDFAPRQRFCAECAAWVDYQELT